MPSPRLCDLMESARLDREWRRERAVEREADRVCRHEASLARRRAEGRGTHRCVRVLPRETYALRVAEGRVNK